MSDYLSKLRRGSGLDSYGNAYQFPYEIEAVSEIEAKDKRIAELEAKNAKLKAVRDAAIRLRNEVKGAIGMPGFCSLVGVTNITILQQRIDAVSGTVEAVESRSLAGRSRHSSAQGVICKPVAAESAQVATNRDRGAQPSLAAAKENE